MKQTLVIFLLSTALVFTLASCGSDPDPISSMIDPSVTNPVPENSPGNEDALPPDNTLNDGNYGSVMPEGGMTTNPTMDSATTQSHARGELFKGASYDQMVRNAKVHDQDGNLRDGENAHTPGIRIF